MKNLLGLFYSSQLIFLASELVNVSWIRLEVENMTVGYLFNIVFSAYLIGFFATFATLFESSSRVIDYVIFSLPRTIEGLWDLFEKLGYVGKMPMNFIFALSIAIAMYIRQTDEEVMPGSYKRALDFIFKS